MKSIVGVGVLVINEHRQALVLTCSKWPDRPDRSQKPDLPGGAVETEEGEREGAVREVFEETGIAIDARSLRLLYAHASTNEWGESVTRLVYGLVLDHTPAVILSWEHESYAWVSYDQMLEKYPQRKFYDNAIRYIQNNQLL